MTTLSTELQQLKSKRNAWISYLDIQRENSIAKQLTGLSWDIICFEIFQEAARFTPNTRDGGKRLNGLVFGLLTKSFFKSFMSDIRKLVDSDTRTISLMRMLLEMKETARLFTRVNMLASEGLEYDWKALAMKEWADLEEGKAHHTSVDYALSRNRHEQIDKLCGVSAKNRKPTDCLTKRLFQDLINKIGTASVAITNYVNDFVAHATAGTNQYKPPARAVIVKELFAAQVPSRFFCKSA